MVLAMLVIPVSDGFIKLLSERYPVLLLNWARFLAGGLIFVPLASMMLKRHRLQRDQVVALCGRTVLHVLAISLYFLAIARIPLADALGAYFVAPIVAILLGTAVLGERFTRTQAIAVLIGFLGAMIVVRPGLSMDSGFFYAIGAGVVFGVFLVLTRKAALSVPPIITLGFQCGLGTLLLLPIALHFWSPIQWPDALLIAGIGGIWAAGHLAAVHAFKHAPGNVLAAIVYFEILGGAGIGYLLFGHIPSVATIVGIALIVAAGLIIQRNTAPPAHQPRVHKQDLRQKGAVA
jgi:drug/metabolite transporter (DMT)-like permease